MSLLETLLALSSWLGHFCLLTSILNHLYGCRISKRFLRPYRLFTGTAILAYPLYAFLLPEVYHYAMITISLVFLPLVTVYRHTFRRGSVRFVEKSETVDYRKNLGEKAIGDGKWAGMARQRWNDVLRVDFTETTIHCPGLPTEFDQLTIHLVSDLHFCGTPGRPFFEAVFGKLREYPLPDLVFAAGDYLDSETHADWLTPLLGKLDARYGKFAVLGNHDVPFDPEMIRKDLTAAGFQVVGNRWVESDIRGVRTVIAGYEGPWFRGRPDLSDAPPSLPRLAISHSPDQFYRAVADNIRFLVAGHVHGGQIRLPLFGSIFVPSVYGRRFDEGVFQNQETILYVGRGLSGREAIRFRCRPQVTRLTLRCG